AVLVRKVRRAPRQLGFLQIVVGAQRQVELLRARHRVHDEAERDVTATALWRTALDVADLPDSAVVFDDVAAFDFGSFHSLPVIPATARAGSGARTAQPARRVSAMDGASQAGIQFLALPVSEKLSAPQLKTLDPGSTHVPVLSGMSSS